MKNKVLITLILVVSIFTITGCGNKKDDNNKYVYAYYNNIKRFGNGPTKLKEYEKNYKKLKDENGKERKFFLGHILDEEGKIERGFVCGVENNKLFCVEAKKDDSMYEDNKKLLYDIYGKDKCKEEEYAGIYYMKCSKDLNVSISSNGSVYIGTSKSEQCYANNDNSMYCY